MDIKYTVRRAVGWGVSMALCASALAGAPETNVSMKEEFIMDESLFSHQLELINLRRDAWLKKAEQSTPRLFSTTQAPVAVIEVEKDSAAFQGWKSVRPVAVDSVCDQPLTPGDHFVLDFGEHLTGYFSFSLRKFDAPVDAPVRLNFIFGETLAEVAEPIEPYTGSLT